MKYSNYLRLEANVLGLNLEIFNRKGIRKQLLRKRREPFCVYFLLDLVLKVAEDHHIGARYGHGNLFNDAISAMQSNRNFPGKT